MPRPFRVAVLVALSILVSGAAVHAGFEPIEETPGLGNQVAALMLEVQDGSPGAAARLVDLWAGGGSAVVRQEDGALLSLAGWVGALSPEQRATLSAQLADTPTGSAALAAVQGAAVDDPGVTPLQLYGKTRVAPLGPEQGPALALVAERAVAWGDLTTGRDLYAAAQALGWTADTERASTIAAAAAAALDRTAPLALPARWYGDPTRLREPRLLPVVAGDVTYVAGLAGTAALRGDATLWTSAWGEADDVADAAPLAGGAGRGPLLQPAVLSDASGSPQIVVVNTPATAELPGRLRAMRATDGRTIWETGDDDIARALRFVGPPTVAGRYVYAVAVRVDGRLGTVLAVCLDVTSGRTLWQAALGSVTDTARDARRRPLEHHWHAPAPFVSGDALILVPGVGYVVAIDRFDGTLRWARPYTVTDADADQVTRFREQLRNRSKDAKPPVPDAQARRITAGVARAGDVLLVAPLDTPAVLGLSATTGRVMWRRDNPPAPTLVGAVADHAIFAGEVVRAIDPATGADRWTATVTPVGPVALAGRQVLVPTVQGVVTIDPGTGQASAARPSAWFATDSPIAATLQAIGAGALLPDEGARK